jgi:HSP20 family protein
MNREWDKIFEQMEEWSQAVDRLMNHIHSVASTRQLKQTLVLETWRPAVDVYETPDAVVVLVEIAGIDPADISIRLESGKAIVCGRRQRLIPETVQMLHRVEIWSGPFAFEVVLPTGIESTKAETSYKAGLLEVKLPKRRATLQQPGTTSVECEG